MPSRALLVLRSSPFFAFALALAVGCGGGIGSQSGSTPESIETGQGEEDGFFSLLSTPPAPYRPPLPVPEPERERSFGACVGPPSKVSSAPRGARTKFLCCYTPPSVFVKYIAKRLPDARACYEEALARDPKVHGRVVSKFTIEEDGTVMQACDAGSTVGDPELVECVLRVMTTVTFMSYSGGEDDPCPPITLNYPILFSPTPVE